MSFAFILIFNYFLLFLCFLEGTGNRALNAQGLRLLETFPAHFPPSRVFGTIIPDDMPLHILATYLARVRTGKERGNSINVSLFIFFIFLFSFFFFFFFAYYLFLFLRKVVLSIHSNNVLHLCRLFRRVFTSNVSRLWNEVCIAREISS